MFTKKTIFRAAGASLAAVLSLAAQPVRAQDPMPSGCKSSSRPSTSYKSVIPSLNRRSQD